MQLHTRVIASDRTARAAAHGTETAGFIGEPPLFGVIHTPVHQTRALLVCSPVYAEFMQNYGREIRLARRLAEHGVATARFHYRGTGDSAGDASDVTIDSMVADALEMVSLLRSETAVESVDVLGTRLAGHVAAQVAANLGDARLVLWEPVADVKRYFNEVFRTRRMVGVVAKDGATTSSAAMLEELHRTGRLDVVGYHVHKALFDSVAAAAFDPAGLSEVLLVQASRTEKVKAAVQKLAGGIDAAGGRSTIAVVPPGEGWWIHDYDEERSPEHGRDAERRLLDTTVSWITDA